ncbi:hypothetical protein [Bifidobacterium callitrichidarum]|uniref:Uncharacterized protein n=1 Tax=Bifidobacterium callitrichidarum TaxID=2052941 RepID=A0A2U2N0Q5_9BIFI|nr:hypothetical protein [Bifidobacterium callitrichidarum]PWG62652.1 hypothetical protein DF196_11885 [Bifidobacterium callitrichidarum]
MPTTTLADTAAAYIKEHRIERQSQAIANDERVTLTIIQNRWADANSKPLAGIDSAPETVMKAIETSASGHRLFSRIRDGKVVVYGLRR